MLVELQKCLDEKPITLTSREKYSKKLLKRLEKFMGDEN